MTTLQIINLAIMLAFFLCYSYQFFYIPVAWWKKDAPHREPVMHRIAVLIAARNEQAVIGNLISKSFSRILVYGSVIAALSAFAGLYISYKTNIPSGASTIFVLTLTLIAVKTTTFVRNKRSLKSR